MGGEEGGGGGLWGCLKRGSRILLQMGWNLGKDKGLGHAWMGDLTHQRSVLVCSTRWVGGAQVSRVD